MKTKISILIPVFNEAKCLPKLFQALEKQKLSFPAEIVFIDNNSEDNSLNLLGDWRKKNKNKFLKIRIYNEKKQGFAYPLKLGIQKASAPLIAITDADCLPMTDWIKKMCAALKNTDICVGNTYSYIGKKSSEAEKLAALFFKDYSKKCARADGFALPWGPTCNLGFHKKLTEKISTFSEHAGPAFDIDFCWRAILQEAKLHYNKDICVKHFRRDTPEALYKQMYRYGSGEAWIRYRYSSIFEINNTSSKLSYTENSAKLAKKNAKLRILKMPAPSSLKKLKQDAAEAFAKGVYDGYKKLNKKKSPEIILRKSVAWENATGGVSIFVPGRGALDLNKKMAPVWILYKSSKNVNHFSKLLIKKLGMQKNDANHYAEEFFTALNPLT